MAEGAGRGAANSGLAEGETGSPLPSGERHRWLPVVARSCVGQPAAQADARFLDLREGRVIVVPAEGLDLLEDVQIGEVVEQLFDKAVVEIGIEGVGGEVMFEVVEDREALGIERVAERFEPSGSGIHSVSSKTVYSSSC